MIWINAIWVIWVDVDVIWIDVIKNYRIFAPNFFNFKNILALSIFENVVASKVLTFNFRCIMSQCAPIGDIWRPSIKYYEDPDVSWWYNLTAIPADTGIPSNSRNTIQTGNTGAYAPDGSRWVHRHSISCVPPKVNINLITNFYFSEGGILIIVSPSNNEINRLVSVNERFVRTCSTYCELFIPYIYSRQWYILYSSAVGVCWLIRHKLIIWILPNQSGN